MAVAAAAAAAASVVVAAGAGAVAAVLPLLPLLPLLPSPPLPVAVSRAALHDEPKAALPELVLRAVPCTFLRVVRGLHFPLARASSCAGGGDMGLHCGWATPAIPATGRVVCSVWVSQLCASSFSPCSCGSGVRPLHILAYRYLAVFFLPALAFSYE